MNSKLVFAFQMLGVPTRIARLCSVLQTWSLLFHFWHKGLAWYRSVRRTFWYSKLVFAFQMLLVPSGTTMQRASDIFPFVPFLAQGSSVAHKGTALFEESNWCSEFLFGTLMSVVSTRIVRCFSVLFISKHDNIIFLFPLWHRRLA